MAPLVLTLVRHGESIDNLTALWAGHRDAALTNHGFNQASRLGAHFANVPITAIYSSDLKRAHSTAKAVHEANAGSSTIPLVVSPILREQNFGDAEGQPWNAGEFNSAHLPWEEHRAFRLAPHSESLADVGERADLALRHFLVPHLLASAQVPEGENGHHVLLVAHGIFLAEMMFALKRAANPAARFLKTGGYSNSGWSRVEISTLETPSPAAGPGPAAAPSVHAELPALALAPHTASLPPPLLPTDPLPAIRVNVVAVNQIAHLDGLVRQGGGIGSAAHDERQKKMKDFFSGASGGGGLTEWTGK